MSSTLAAPPLQAHWKSSPAQWLALAVAFAAMVLWHYPALEFMVATWQTVEEYSYGWFVPIISAYLMWQRSEQLRRMELVGSWWGLPVLALALLLGAVGHLSAIRVFSQYGFVVGLFGIALAAVGWRGTRILAVPLAMLLLMIPLPQFLLREVSHGLQLISSQLGVSLIRLFGISVFLEGNVIDLGSYKLQVVEACNGLRYLFPLLVLGCLAAYFFRAAWWKRAWLVLSTVPLTILINSLRIGLIGVTVEYWGTEMAEGLLHDLEGWFMFLICLALLLVEMLLLARLGNPGLKLADVFVIDLPPPAARGALPVQRRLSTAQGAAAALMAAAAVLALSQPERTQQAPPRTPFSAFPLQLPGGWTARTDKLMPDIVAALAVTDYFLGNYTRGGEQGKVPWVNFYSAYYASQSGGESSHSPRTCIPGDGWTILTLEQVDVPDFSGLRVNRALVQKGEHRQLVYYWFRQRGRNMTGEFEVKWRILRDSIVIDRSDGALLRLVTPLAPGEDAAVAERRLVDFLRAMHPLLGAYIPD